jgi:hypothetical protein
MKVGEGGTEIVINFHDCVDVNREKLQNFEYFHDYVRVNREKLHNFNYFHAYRSIIIKKCTLFNFFQISESFMPYLVINRLS